MNFSISFYYYYYYIVDLISICKVYVVISVLCYSIRTLVTIRRPFLFISMNTTNIELSLFVLFLLTRFDVNSILNFDYIEEKYAISQLNGGN
jgi:hypothetical protein